MGAVTTFCDQLAAATTALEAAGVASPRVDAEWLLAGLLGVGRVAVRLDPGGAVPEPLAERYADAVRRRARREPLQRILGWEEFRGLRVRLTDAVLVPRPETEALVEWALALMPARGARRLLAVDLGTGSGCIAYALGLAARIRVVATDLLDGVRDLGADLIVSNPPYLPTGLVPELPPEVRTHEPVVALDGGADGLALIRRIAASARRALRASGVLVVETAGGVQATAVAALLRTEGWVQVAIRVDLAGVDRFVAGRA
jgi:release factor glutamine methyltransferase